MKDTGLIGVSTEDAKELDILNRTIKIGAQNDETTLKADRKLVEDDLKTVGLVGAEGLTDGELRAEATSYRSMV